MFAVDAAAVNPNGIKTFLTNGLTTFFINGKPVFNNGPRSLLRNPPDNIDSDSWVFDNLILANKLFAKLASSLELPIIFDEIIRVTSVALSVADFNSLSCELYNFTLQCYIESYFYSYYIKAK